MNETRDLGKHDRKFNRGLRDQIKLTPQQRPLAIALSFDLQERRSNGIFCFGLETARVAKSRMRFCIRAACDIGITVSSIKYPL